MPRKKQSERDRIVEYVELETGTQEISSIEKVDSISAGGQQFDFWRVSTKDDWWVVTPPTNLYPLHDYPDIDSVVEAHAGAIDDLDEPDSAKSLSEYFVRTEKSWETLNTAHKVLEEAESSDEIQAVRGHPRQALVQFVKKMSETSWVSDLENLPPEDDHQGWLLRIADAVCADEHLREHIRSIINATWAFVVWIEQTENPERPTVEMAVSSAGHVVHQLNKLAIAYERR